MRNAALNLWYLSLALQSLASWALYQRRTAYPWLFRWCAGTLILSLPLLIAQSTSNAYRWLYYAKTPVALVLFILVTCEIERKLAGTRKLTALHVGIAMIAVTLLGLHGKTWPDYPMLEFANAMTAAVMFGCLSAISVLWMRCRPTGAVSWHMGITALYAGVGTVIYLAETMRVWLYVTNVANGAKAAICFGLWTWWARRER